MNKHTSYTFLDSGNGRKLERFGPYVLDRPCAQALWLPRLPTSEWAKADALFTRDTDNKWIFKHKLPECWTAEAAGIKFKISPTDFGHLGIFPEQEPFWDWIQTTIRSAVARKKQPVHVLNLFAYSGGATLSAAKAGAHVCHLDASKGMVSWARENAALNNLENAPIRWIVEDVSRFLAREIKRGKKYEAIILDPPSFGRGSKGEIFKIEDHLIDLLKQCRELLSENPLFIIFSCHTPGYTPMAMNNVLGSVLSGLPGTIESGEMALTGNTLSLPSGTYARWLHE